MTGNYFKIVFGTLVLLVTVSVIFCDEDEIAGPNALAGFIEPRQMFVPPPKPPCPEGYARVDGECKYKLNNKIRIGGITPNIATNQITDDIQFDENIADPEIKEKYELKDPTNKNSKRIARPDILSIPRSNTKCPPRHILDHNGACKRRFGGKRK